MAESSFGQWTQYAIHFFVLANSGGAVATLSFMGASDSVPILGVLTLACFVAGIATAGLTIVGQLTAAYRIELNPGGILDPAGTEASIRKSFVTRLGDWIEGKTGRFLATAYLLFIIGAMIGVLALALYEK